jgi:small-conductance mechanosensitive channel/CRP-like cAMP-binding protein
VTSLLERLADLRAAVSLDPFGVALALILIVVLRVLLPAPARRLLRQPVAMLGLHLVAVAAHYAVEGQGFATAHAAMDFLAQLLLLASIGRSSVLLVLDVVFGRRLVRPLPRIIRDITQGVVYIAVTLVALRSAGVEPGSILTTSALLTAAIALSLQETLGNMVAGLAIQAQRPFDEGDWIQFDADPKHIGRVLEINWRATKVITLDEVEVIVPNATLAKAPITNFTKPTRVSRRSIYVAIPGSVPPHVVQRAVLEALESAPGVLPQPAPSCVTNAFVEGNIEYWVRFFTEQFDKRDGVDGAVRDRVWYALSRAGVNVASPNVEVAMREQPHDARARAEAAGVADRDRALCSVDFLDTLTEEQRRRLAAESRTRLYVAGEPIVRQGEQSAEMFVIESGEVAVARERVPGAGQTEVARLGRGKFFGEMALMTGEPRAATVRALGPCTLLCIDQRAMRRVLEDAPGLAEHISRVIAERQAALADEDSNVAPETDREERTTQILGRIRKFFAL